MITFHKPGIATDSWQHAFSQILPEIDSRLRFAFRRFDPQRRDEYVQDGIVHCLLAYVRLFERGRADSVTPANLVWYAVLQTKSGREAGCRMSTREPLSRYAQLRKHIVVERLSSSSASNGNWIDLIVEDKRMSVADQVAARLDLRAWLATLPRRSRLIVKDLALGYSTSEVANKFGFTPSRISQLRRELKSSWEQFQSNAQVPRTLTLPSRRKIAPSCGVGVRAVTSS